MITLPSISSPFSSVFTATAPLGSVLSTTAPYASGLSAIVPITSYPSQSPTLPLPQLPKLPEASLSSLVDDASTGDSSASVIISSSIPTLTIPTGVPAGNMTTLPTSVPSAALITSPDIDREAFLANATTAVQVLEVLITVLKGDSGDVLAVSIPEVGMSIGSNNELAELLRGIAVSLLA